MTVDALAGRLCAAVQETAGSLESSDSHLPEREIEEAALSVLIHQGYEFERPESQVGISLEGWQGRLGPLDLALKDASGAIAAAIELKSGGADQLSACAWDAVKLGQALAEEKVSRGFLLAAAPLSAWQEHASGTELFESQVFALNTHLRRYEKWFDFWRRDVQNYPRLLPSRWETSALGEGAFARAGMPWELRLTEIFLSGSQMRVIYAPKGLGEEGDIPDPQAEGLPGWKQ